MNYSTNHFSNENNKYSSPHRFNERMNRYCNNCGKQGHLYSQCKVPITSYGIIAFRYNPNLGENEYLMVCRQNSFGFIDFMRGKYSIYNKDYIGNMVKQMTVQEKKDLVSMEFDDLWKKLWKIPSHVSVKFPMNFYILEDGKTSENSQIPPPPPKVNWSSLNKSSKGKYRFKLEENNEDNDDNDFSVASQKQIYKNEEMTSKDKFNALRKGVYKCSEKNDSSVPPSYSTFRYGEETVRPLRATTTPRFHYYSLYSIIDEYVLGEQWLEPEWGFPKGRRNYQEKDYETAVREFKEETGYDPKYLKNIQNIFPFEENLVGSNYKSYKHKYYLMSMEYNDSLRTDDYSNSEISSVKWKTYQECIDSIRNYNIEKKKIIQNIHECLGKYGLFY